MSLDIIECSRILSISTCQERENRLAIFQWGFGGGLISNLCRVFSFTVSCFESVNICATCFCFPASCNVCYLEQIFVGAAGIERPYVSILDVVVKETDMYTLLTDRYNEEICLTQSKHWKNMHFNRALGEEMNALSAYISKTGRN